MLISFSPTDFLSFILSMARRSPRKKATSPVIVPDDDEDFQAVASDDEQE